MSLLIFEEDIIYSRDFTENGLPGSHVIEEEIGGVIILLNGNSREIRNIIKLNSRGCVIKWHYAIYKNHIPENKSPRRKPIHLEGW